MSIEESKRIKRKSAYHSIGYTPTFNLCPNCNHTLGWKEIDEEHKCNKCGQKLLGRYE